MKYFLYACLSVFGAGVLGYAIIRLFAPKNTIITSWWRTKTENQEIYQGNEKWSWHMLGLAYDITGPNNTVSQELFEWAKNTFPSVIVEKNINISSVDNADHLHVAWINKIMGVIKG
jgi:hypothetical protein